MREEIINRLTKLENGIAQFEDVIGTESDDLRKECSVIPAEAMRAHLAGLAEENRLLNIGIIGRVKAGKSSLLNSIFFEGKSVLPKAATPMTASLTVMTYGDAFSATVEYFSGADIETIKKEHKDYIEERERKYEENKKTAEERAKKRVEAPDMDKVKRSTDREMESSPKYASYLQYEEMKKSGVQPPTGTTQTLDAKSDSDLLEKLNEYVGSGGRMMPYTKSAEIRFPLDALRDICIVDTPGINDPVKSREARTEEYLKKCDVVFIVSPAGQFISSEDMALMDRLFAKEGVRELYLVASQADTQLYGSVKDISKQNLNKAVDQIRSDISEQALSNLAELKKNNPEVAGQFDQLLKDGRERVLLTSAICHAMSLRFDNRNSWDNDMNHIWGLLRKEYPDYFDTDASAQAGLELLSGIKTVYEKIVFARSKKDEIMAQKQADYTAGQEKNIKDFSQKLVDMIKTKIEIVKTTKIETVKKQKKDLEKLFSKGTEAIDGTFEDCVDDFKANVRDMISKESRNLFQEAKGEAEGAEGSTTKQGSRYRHEWLWGFIKFGKEYYSYEVRTLRTGAVKSTLNNLVFGLQELLVNSAEKEKRNWKASVQRKVTNALTDAVEDVDLIDFNMLKTALRRLVNNMELPNLDLGSNTFNSSHSGTLEGDYEIDRFIDEVESYRSHLRTVFNKATDEFLSTMEKTAKREKMSDMIFADLKKQLESLEKEIENKEYTLDQLKKCLAALEKAAE